MKTITLLAAAVLMVNAANATEVINTPGAENRNTRFSFDEPIAFTERGIEFFVFPNGEFDFNTETTTGSDVYYRNGRRSATNTTHGAPGHMSDGGVRIEHDSKGRVRRIGNVFLNYDSTNRIKRIGSVYMTYNRSALVQIGDMRIIYNRRGQIVDMIGHVNDHYGYAYNGNGYHYGPVATQDDNDYYYYRMDGTKAKIEEKK